MVGITLPMRSNAVARSPVRSPTFTVTDGGATCTSPTVWAATVTGIMKSSEVEKLRKFMAGANVRPPERGCQPRESRRSCDPHIGVRVTVHFVPGRGDGHPHTAHAGRRPHREIVR